MKLIHLLFVFVILNFSNTFASDDDYVWITTGTDVLKTLQTEDFNFVESSTFKSNSDATILKVKREKLLELTHHTHEEHKRCGGYIVHDSEVDAFNELANARLGEKLLLDFDYTISQEELVRPAMTLVQQERITADINKLSSFHNRYHKSEHGLKSQEWLLNHWKSIAVNRADVSVDYFEHPGRTPQPSVIMTFTGSEMPEEIVVIGGHADSINGMFFPTNRRAPGADDNASGIATLTEAARVLIESSYRPKRTIIFAGYAAEEVGLVGSADMAKRFKAQEKNVVGVLQLDMTNFNGSDLDILLVSDFTNEAQNKFVGSLIDKYLAAEGVKWGYTACGYACSDHASWTKNGFAASTPFESKKRDMNNNIHTANDVIEQSGGHAEHAEKFSKLAVSYAMELAK